jgi:hypothetical protein
LNSVDTKTFREKTEYARSARQEKLKRNITSRLTSCEAYSSLRENFLNELESDPTNETDLNEHSLSVEIMKSTDKETVIKLSKFISLCFEKRSKRLEARNADSQYAIELGVDKRRTDKKRTRTADGGPRKADRGRRTADG